jgi:hypothetical protein
VKPEQDPGTKQPLRYQIAGVAALIGVVAGYSAGAMMHFPPFPIQRLLQNQIASAVVVLIGFGTVASMAVWAQQPSSADRRAFVVPIVSFGGLALVANVLAPTFGWWGGPVFAAPLLPLAVLTALRAMFLIGLLLLLYRWLAARRVWLARGVYVVILLALIPATIVGDQMILRSGVLTFGNGYTIWKDVLLGEFGFAFPVVLYELLRRASRVAT